MNHKNIIEREDHGFRTGGSIVKRNDTDTFMSIIKHKVDSDREFRRLNIKNGPHYIEFSVDNVKLINTKNGHKTQRLTNEFFELHKDEIQHVITFLQSLIK